MYEELPRLRIFTDIDAKRKGPFPLLVAAEASDLMLVDSLLAAGADVNLSSPEGWSALSLAAKQGHEEVLLRLLDKGAHLDISASSFSAVHGAALFGRDACLRLLLTRSADPNAWSRGTTALMCAATNGHAETARLLLAHGARADLTNDWGKTALQVAESRGHTTCAGAIFGGFLWRAKVDPPRLNEASLRGDPTDLRSLYL